MPVQYSGVLEEHKAVRTAAGLFDVSHMGEIEIRGPEAAAFVDYAATNHASKLKPGQAHYSGLLYDHGGFVDDILVHKVAGDHFFLCVNAANQEKDFEHLRSLQGFQAEVDLASDRYAQLAIQGPCALATLAKLTATDLAAIRYYWFTDGAVCGVPARIARTGYTGEDGFEIFCAAPDAPALWDRLLEAAGAIGGKPVGLGARDTLRLEARLPLYGNDLDETTTPLEAGLGWVVKLDGADFIGKPALLEQKAKGVARKLVGFVMRGRGVARHGYAIHAPGGGDAVGEVTSGTFGPTVEKNIGMGYVPAAMAAPGGALTVDCRGKMIDAEIVNGPFYKRGKR